MLKTLSLTAVLALLPLAAAAEVETEIEDFAFSFEGPFGTYDENQLQRGLQVFTEVCSACHGLEYVAFHTLTAEGGPGLPEDQMRAYAAQHEVYDAAKDQWVPATPADYYPVSALDNAPDLSLMAKARAGFHGPYGSGINQFFKGMGGSEYIASLLTGYHEPPACAPDDFEGSYNIAFANGGYPEACKNDAGEHIVPGSWIAMPEPLYGEDVIYNDGHSNEMEHEAQDVAAFLMWAAEPHMMARKQAGLVGVLFLALLAVLLYATNKRLWAPHKGKKKHQA